MAKERRGMLQGLRLCLCQRLQEAPRQPSELWVHYAAGPQTPAMSVVNLLGDPNDALHQIVYELNKVEKGESLRNRGSHGRG